MILVKNYIAFTPNYLPNVPEKQRQEFWLGKVTEIHAQSEKVKNASSGNNTATYTLFTGGRSAKFDWVTSDRREEKEGLGNQGEW